ncbi:MAG: AAA family ATPase [Prevotella sp.]
MSNDHLLLVVGKSTTGKSMSLNGLDNPEGVMYLNCENGKRLPFRSKFKEYTITDPLQVYEAFTAAEGMPHIHTIIVDSLTYLMDMYESVYVLTSTNTMKSWGDYAQFFKNLMQQYVAKSSKKVIFIAHTRDSYNESEMVRETSVPVKGSLQSNGIESYFTCVIAAKKVKVNDLVKYKSELLNITEEEKMLEYKHVFQTRLTRDTVNERIRNPVGLFSTDETFIDNSVQSVLNRLETYYK